MSAIDSGQIVQEIPDRHPATRKLGLGQIIMVYNPPMFAADDNDPFLTEIVNKLLAEGTKAEDIDWRPARRPSRSDGQSRCSTAGRVKSQSR